MTTLNNSLSKRGLPPIEVYSSAIVGDGVTDDSVAIKAAHDAAFAAGVRELYCSRQYNAPTAWNIGLVIFRGPGALIGTYRKNIVPFSARRAVLGSRQTPSIHLANYSKALSPTILVFSDSTGTIGANHISLAEMIWTIWQRAFLRDNPGRTITRVNRAIGGTAYSNFNNTGTTLLAAGIALPSWFTVTTAPWSGFVSNQNPNMVLIDFGTNAPTGTNYATIDAVVQFVLGLGASVCLVTNLPRSTQADVGSAQLPGLESRDNSAGATRSYAEFNGLPFIDLHRAGCQARDGFDPCTQIMTQNIASQSFNLPATLPQTAGDFDLTFTIDNTGGAAFGTSQKLDILLSAQTGNTLRISQSGSDVNIIGFNGAASTTWLSSLTTAVVMPQAVVTIEVSVRASWISIYVQGNVVYEGLCFRHVACLFQPTVVYGVGSGAASIVVGPYITSSPMLAEPSLTDGEMFGTGSFPQGGNGINHPASPAYEAIIAPEIEALACSASGRPTQTISGAGAINPTASLVELTGPATGTYAITLASPRVQDQGNTLAIEMKATTSTNSVTLALTNVSGGTAGSSCTWNAAAQKLILLACGTTWEVIKQDGVTLS